MVVWLLVVSVSVFCAVWKKKKKEESLKEQES